MRDDTSTENSDLPILTIRETSARTGVAPATLRTWERRYGVPKPARTATGYRLYTRGQLREIAELRQLVEAGIAIRQAAFLTVRERALTGGGASSSEVAGWRRRLESACVRFDERACDQVVDQASRRLTMMSTLRDVVFPVVATLGDGRHAGVISVSQEHFATEVARRVVAQQVSAGPVERLVVVTGCAPGEQHELGLLAVVAGLRHQGVRVAHLGCNVPVDAFLATVDRLHAHAAVIGATLGPHLRPWIRRAPAVRQRAASGAEFIWAGPGATTDVTRDLPGTVSTSIDDVITLVKRARRRARRR
jgi:DNA-binding transcriptional MerR regulator